MNSDNLEFLIFELFRWRGKSLQKPLSQISFTRIELMKLMFFVSAIRVNGDDILDIFSEFYAMPMGPVEITSYNRLLNNEIGCCVVDDRYVRLVKGIDERRWIINDEISRIQTAIAGLESINPDIIIYPAHRLVEISHVWRCWEVASEIASVLGRNSFKMSVKSIRLSNQFFGV